MGPKLTRKETTYVQFSVFCFQPCGWNHYRCWHQSAKRAVSASATSTDRHRCKLARRDIRHRGDTAVRQKTGTSALRRACSVEPDTSATEIHLMPSIHRSRAFPFILPLPLSNIHSLSVPLFRSEFYLLELRFHHLALILCLLHPF